MNTETTLGKQHPDISFENDPNVGRRVFSFFLGLCFLGVTFTILYFGISFTKSNVNEFNLIAIFNLSKFYLVAAICTFLIFLFFSILAFPQKTLHLHLTKDHLVLRKGRNTLQMRWSEIEFIRFRITRYLLIRKETRQSCKIWIKSTRRDRALILRNIVDLGSALTIIRERIFPYIYTQTLNNFDNGKPLSFGKITLQRELGISYQHKPYAWDKIRSLQVRNGRVLTWSKKGKLIQNYSISKIPNFDVFLSIIQRQGIEVSII